MATYEVLALATEKAKKYLAHMLRTGRSYKISGFTVGNQGHDPADRYSARTPDIGLTFQPLDQTVYPPIPLSQEDIDESSGVLSPKIRCQLGAGVATGVVSSIYIYANIVYDPTVVLPALVNKGGKARYVDLPSGLAAVGDVWHVLEDGQDYYWNGTQWLPVTERFLFAIGYMPELIKVSGQDDTYEVSVQF